MSLPLNAWGHPTVSPLEAIRSGDMSEAIRLGMQGIFAEFLLPGVMVDALVETTWNASADSDMAGFDRRLQVELIGRLDNAKIRGLLDDRARHVARQVAPHATGGSLLDVGTGDGMVAWNLQKHFDQHLLSDVIDYRDPRVTLPFALAPEGTALPVADAAFENVLLTNVLHHALDPLFLLDEAARVASRRLIIIESVYGAADRLGEPKIPFCLPVEKQFVYTSYFDWFYNRVLHSDVPVPFNFLRPAEWEVLFGDRGLRIVASEDLGIDVEIVPIHHVLYVLEK